jgi:hypothetical protein
LLTLLVVNFAPAFHATEGRILVPFFDKFASTWWDQNQQGRATTQHITHFPQMNYALVADSSLWLLALYLPFSVLIFCGQFCTLVKKFTNTFFTWSQLSDWEYYKNMITNSFFFFSCREIIPFKINSDIGHHTDWNGYFHICCELTTLNLLILSIWFQRRGVVSCHEQYKN